MRPRSVITALSTEQARALGAANDPSSGIATCRVAPDLRRRHELGQDILAALGVNSDLSGKGRNTSQDWEVLAVRLVASGIRHLVLLDAQWLPAAVAADVVLLAAVCDLDLWLVAQDPDDTHTETLAELGVRPASASELDELVRSSRRPLTPAPTVTLGGFPRVPTANFTTFRATCRDRLAPEAFGLVDDRYRAAHGAALDGLGAQVPLTEDGVIAWLRGQVDACETADEMLVVIRAAQAAAFTLGALVRVNLPRLLTTAETAPNAAVRSPLTWQRLDAYREPYRAAACALAAVGFSEDELRAVTVGDVDPSGRVVAVTRDGASLLVEVPVGAERHVRTQQLLRVTQGATNDDVFFAARGGEPVAGRHLVYAITAPMTELGVAVVSGNVSRAAVSSQRWANRWGVSVQAL